VAITRLLSKTVPDWTVVLGLAIAVVILPGILVLKSSSLACATAKEVVADPEHPDNQLTVNQGTIIKVTVPKDAAPFGGFAQVSTTNSTVIAVDQTPCGWQARDDAISFDFRAVASGSAQLQTIGPSAGSMFAFGWTPAVWEVTVSGLDYGPVVLVGIELTAVAMAGAFIWYRRR
jgi:hypothetical protein